MISCIFGNGKQLPPLFDTSKSEVPARTPESALMIRPQEVSSTEGNVPTSASCMACRRSAISISLWACVVAIP